MAFPDPPTPIVDRHRICHIADHYFLLQKHEFDQLLAGKLY